LLDLIIQQLKKSNEKSIFLSQEKLINQTNINITQILIHYQSMPNSTITLTLGDCAENHVRMQTLGEISDSGFTLIHLRSAKKWFDKLGAKSVIYDLNWPLEHMSVTPDSKAYVLVVRQGVNYLLQPKTADDLMAEQINLPWDTKAFMYGKVVNKHARHNLCYTETSQEPDYANGKGRVIALNQVPLLKKLIERIPKIVGPIGQNLVAEGNYYYDITKCGIGFHGDTERKKVIGIRLGESIPLEYQWFHNLKPVGDRMRIMLCHGDIYFMSEKATGNDWKKRITYTLRHAAGAEKFLAI